MLGAPKTAEEPASKARKTAEIMADQGPDEATHSSELIYLRHYVQHTRWGCLDDCSGDFRQIVSVTKGRASAADRFSGNS